MNYGEIKWYDIANGQGVRISLFVSGCDHHCKACFQPETWDYGYGELYTKDIEDKIISTLSHKEYLKGLSLLGGDPLCGDNYLTLIPLIKRVSSIENKDIWCYTGYTYEELIKMNNPKIQEFLSYIDILVDGPFIEKEKDISLQFRGSRNQRIIACKESTLNNIILCEFNRGEI